MVDILESTELKRARSFDLNALAKIYDTFSPKIYRYAFRLLGDENLAEECVAETFHRLLAVFKAGAGPKDHLQAYLYRIAHNWIMDYYRQQPPPLLDLEASRNIGNVDQNINSADPLLVQQIRAALTRLTPDQRQVIVLKYIEGLNIEEIAQALNKPITAVKALQHRGLNSLRRLLLPMENSR